MATDEPPAALPCVPRPHPTSVPPRAGGSTRARRRLDESGKRAQSDMPTIPKGRADRKAEYPAPVTALASRDRAASRRATAAPGAVVASEPNRRYLVMD